MLGRGGVVGRFNPSLVAVEKHLTKFYEIRPVRHWGYKIMFVLELIKLVFSMQIVTFRFDSKVLPRFFRQTLGLTTGCSCAVELANLFLLELDHAVICKYDNILLYRRYVDDLLIMAGINLDMQHVLEFMNKWMASISISREAGESADSVHFLDVTYTLGDGPVDYKTYRKPQNSYAYVPWNSSHARACLKGIVHTELRRMSRTCRSSDDFVKQVAFFRGRLFKRGYPRMQVDRIIDDFEFVSSSSQGCKRNIVPFKMTYCHGAEQVCIGEILKCHAEIIENINISPIQCFTSDRSLFRKRFHRFR